MMKNNQLTRHANAAKPAAFINARSFILARIRLAFVDIHFTTATFETRQAIAAVRTRHVDTSTTVLARRT